jgi:ABC-type nitrate/sulfonate/bicarbonate transport system permease component
MDNNSLLTWFWEWLYHAKEMILRVFFFIIISVVSAIARIAYELLVDNKTIKVWQVCLSIFISVYVGVWIGVYIGSLGWSENTQHMVVAFASLLSNSIMKKALTLDIESLKNIDLNKIKDIFKK